MPICWCIRSSLLLDAMCFFFPFRGCKCPVFGDVQCILFLLLSHYIDLADAEAITPSGSEVPLEDKAITFCGDLRCAEFDFQCAAILTPCLCNRSEALCLVH